MEKSDIDYKKVYGKLTKRYITASIILVILFISKQAIVQYKISNEENSSRVINIAGRQRMLSQKIAKDLLQIKEKPYNSLDANYYMEDLSKSLKLWEDSQYNLIKGNKEEGITKKNSDVVVHMYDDLEPNFNIILVNTNEILEMVKQPNYDQVKLEEKMAVIDLNEKIFLDKMNEIVYRYDYEAKKAISIIEITDLSIFAMLIIAIAFIAIFVFVPISKTLNKAFWDVNESYDNISKIFHTMKGALFIVKEDGQVILMNSDAEKFIVFDKIQGSIFNLKQNMNWLNVNIIQILDGFKEEDILEEFEGEIEDRDGNIHNVILSGAKGTYKGDNIISLSMFDITQQKKAEEVLKNIAVRDKLTQLYNRHFMETIIEEEIGRAERYEIPLSVFILDLDHFKKVNDKWGHPIGDSVLKMTADILLKNTRMSDYAVRIGGEEFVVLMPHTNLEGAYLAAEKVREAIEISIHPVAGKFTASFGVAERKLGETYHSLYERMDSALYQAKAGGRNCVMRASEHEQEYESVPLNWKKAWNCGELNIDEQHKELFSMASNFLNNSFYQKDIENEVEYFDKVLEHIKNHFQYEESVLEKVKYQEYTRHKNIHKQLLEKGIKIRNEVSDSNIESSKAVAFLFEDVIIGHLFREDVKFFSCIG